MNAPPPEGLAPRSDVALGFTVPARNVRGQLVRLDTSLNAILAAHDYPPPLARLLAEALVLTALLGATLRPGQKIEDGSLTLQVQAPRGAVDLLVCDYRAGAVRGYLNVNTDAEIRDGMTLSELFGDGYLAITLDQTTSTERYQGIVALEGDSLSAAIEAYFDQSEQLPTLIRIGISGDAATGWLAGGLLLQHLARREEGGERLEASERHPDWEHVEALAGTTKAEELTDPLLSAEALLWRLFHEEEVRTTAGLAPTRGCRCNIAHITEVLQRFPESERAEMRGDDGLIGVDCKFCARVWKVPA